MLQKTLVVLLAFIVIGKCEQATEILPRMIGGINTLAGEAPSVVSIRVPRQEGGATQFFCSGTIINLNHILTSCQCVHNETNHLINPSWFRIIAGDLNIMVPSFRRFTTSASHIYTHPSYTINPRTNDIAVIRTSTSFPSLHNTIDWAPRNTRVLPINPHSNCRFVGWGSPTTAGVLNAVQQRMEAPMLDRNSCNEHHRGLVLDHMICAGNTGINPSNCIGNLGGGLFCLVGTNWQLTGVLSFGIGCGATNTPGVYTQVRFFEAWINQQFTRTDATPAGTLLVA